MLILYVNVKDVDILPQPKTKTRICQLQVPARVHWSNLLRGGQRVQPRPLHAPGHLPREERKIHTFCLLWPRQICVVFLLFFCLNRLFCLFHLYIFIIYLLLDLVNSYKCSCTPGFRQIFIKVKQQIMSELLKREFFLQAV